MNVLADLLMAGRGLDLIEQRVDADEVGGPPRHLPARGIPIALIRGTTRISFSDPAFQHVERGDIVVSIADSANLD